MGLGKLSDQQFLQNFAVLLMQASCIFSLLHPNSLNRLKINSQNSTVKFVALAPKEAIGTDG